MHLSDVCLYVAYIGPKSRTERHTKTKISTEICKWAILMARLAMRMRRVTWQCGMGQPKPHIYNQLSQFAYSQYNFCGPMMTIEGSLYGAVFDRKNVPSKAGPKLAVFGNKRVKMLNFCFLTPKRHILARNHVIWHILREAGASAVVVGRTKKEAEKRTNTISDAQFGAYREEKSLESS